MKNLFSYWRYIRLNSPGSLRYLYLPFKWGWQRVTRGFADCDTWNLDMHLLNHMSDTIRYLADHSHGWPQSKEFPEFEDWQKYLREMANHFYRANENNECFPFSFENDEDFTLENLEAYEKQFDDEFHAGLQMLEKHFWNLWD